MYYFFFYQRWRWNLYDRCKLYVENTVLECLTRLKRPYIINLNARNQFSNIIDAKYRLSSLDLGSRATYLVSLRDKGTRQQDYYRLVQIPVAKRPKL